MATSGAGFDKSWIRSTVSARNIEAKGYTIKEQRGHLAFFRAVDPLPL